MPAGDARHVLCVANYPSNTGYAWDFIEGLYARLADRLAADGIRTFVAYPQLESAPRALEGSAAEAVLLDARLEDRTSRDATEKFISASGIGLVYLTDHEAVSPVYPRLRRAGARCVLVHDHTSGARDVPRGVKRLAKSLRARWPGFACDRLVAVSDYVKERAREVSMLPDAKVVRVWNGIPLPAEPLRLSCEREEVVLACACRATPEKGVAHLLEAFDRLSAQGRTNGRYLRLRYAGDGPAFAELAARRTASPFADRIELLGFRRDALAVLASADVVVVPSVWQDALPLSILEAMGLGLPLVACRVGGVPEMLRDGEDGLLVPPADAGALAAAIARLLDDPALGRRLGASARCRVAHVFTPERQLAALEAEVRWGLAL